MFFPLSRDEYGWPTEPVDEMLALPLMCERALADEGDCEGDVLCESEWKFGEYGGVAADGQTSRGWVWDPKLDTVDDGNDEELTTEDLDEVGNELAEYEDDGNLDE